MTTIFTDDFSYSDIDIEIREASIGIGEITFATDDNREFTLRLMKGQLIMLAEVLEMHGYISPDVSQETEEQ